MKIVPYSDVHRTAWNDLSERSHDAWLFHRSEWIDIESRYFAEANHSFAIANPSGSIVGLQPLYFRNLQERLLDSGLHRHTGLALENTLTSSEIRAARALAMEHILSLALRHDIDRIQLNAHNLAPHNLSIAREEIPFWVSDYGFYLGIHFSSQGIAPAPEMATCCADQIVTLAGLDEDNLFKKLDESCQRAVRKAVRMNLTLTFAESRHDIDEYYTLALASAQRSGEQLPPIEYYLSIFENFRPIAKCAIVFALHNGQKIGALFLLMEKNAVSFLAGASLPELLPTRVNDFLHWSAIKWARSSGYAHYRLGPIFPEVDDDWPIAKVSRFKKKFGGRHVSTIQGSFFLKPERYRECAIQAIETVCLRRESLTSRSNDARSHRMQTVFSNHCLVASTANVIRNLVRVLCKTRRSGL